MHFSFSHYSNHHFRGNFFAFCNIDDDIFSGNLRGETFYCGSYFLNDEKLSLEELRALVRPFATPTNARGFFEVGLTLSLFFLFLFLAGFAAKHSSILAIFLGISSGLILVRIFILQHDCGHRSLFTTPSLNLWIGRFLGLLTLTPYDEWNTSHRTHHQHTGQLDVRRHEGSIWLYTTDEYEKLSHKMRCCYRLYHFPLILHVVGPVLLFVIQYRLWWLEKERARRRSMFVTNLVLVPILGTILYVVGLKILILVFFSAIVTASTVGVWFFYIQHIFENAYFAHDKDYSRRDAIMTGSSYYQLPRILDWLTASIGYHSLHHLNPSIPSYRLRACWKKVEGHFCETPKFTFLQSFRLIGLSLWDEKTQKMVGFP